MNADSLIETADDLQPGNEPADTDFYFDAYACHFDQLSTGIINWQWHPEVELSRLAKGSIICAIGSEEHLIEEGQYFFINSNVLHMLKPITGCEDAIKETITFHPSLLAPQGSSTYSGYIDTVISSGAMDFFYFDAETPWQEQMCILFDEIYALDRDSCFGYELRCKSRLIDWWLLMADHMRGIYQGDAVSESRYINEQRTKQMLSFIQQHYGEDLTIDAIAASASVSRSECFRCFRRSINKKPIEFLTEYRVEQAIRLLREGELSISQISDRCGFSSPSYFGKVFREATNVSPKHYRPVSEGKYTTKTRQK